MTRLSHFITNIDKNVVHFLATLETNVSSFMGSLEPSLGHYIETHTIEVYIVFILALFGLFQLEKRLFFVKLAGAPVRSFVSHVRRQPLHIKRRLFDILIIWFLYVLIKPYLATIIQVFALLVILEVVWISRHKWLPHVKNATPTFPGLPSGKGGSGKVIIARFLSFPLYAGKHDHNQVVVGGTGSGKTSSFVIPNIVNFKGSVVATSTKLELVRDTLAAVLKKGPVYVLDLRGEGSVPLPQGIVSFKFNPAFLCESWDVAIQRASQMCIKSGNQSANDEFWQIVAKQLLAPLLFAIASRKLPFGELVTWLRTERYAEPLTICQEVQGAGGEAYQALTSLANLPAQTRQGVVTTALSAIDAYQGHILTEANESIYEDERLANMIRTGKGTLFIVSPLDAVNHGPIICALLDYLYLVVRKTSDQNHDRGLDHGSLWLLDELANLSPLRQLPQMLSTVRSYNLTLSCIIQDFSQLEHIYGKPLTQTIMQNCTTVLFSGSQNVEMLKKLQDLSGSKWIIPPGGNSKNKKEVPKISIKELSNFGRGRVRIISPSKHYKRQAAFYKKVGVVRKMMKG